MIPKNYPYHFNRNTPLHPEDTESQTFGCRAFNPDNCKNCMDGKCAFHNESHICKNPPRGWPKQFKILKEKEGK